VIDFERERRVVSETAASAMQAALESAGVIFVEENGDGPGVRLKAKAGRSGGSGRQAKGRSDRQ